MAFAAILLQDAQRSSQSHFHSLGSSCKKTNLKVQLPRGRQNDSLRGQQQPRRIHTWSPDLPVPWEPSTLARFFWAIVLKQEPTGIQWFVGGSRTALSCQGKKGVLAPVNKLDKASEPRRTQVSPPLHTFPNRGIPVQLPMTRISVAVVAVDWLRGWSLFGLFRGRRQSSQSRRILRVPVAACFPPRPTTHRPAFPHHPQPQRSSSRPHQVLGLAAIGQTCRRAPHWPIVQVCF